MATGESGPRPKILIWRAFANNARSSRESSGPQILRNIRGILRTSVNHLSFSQDGLWLAAIGGDDSESARPQQILAVFDWNSNSCVFSANCGKVGFLLHDVRIAVKKKQIKLASSCRTKFWTAYTVKIRAF